MYIKRAPEYLRLASGRIAVSLLVLLLANRVSLAQVTPVPGNPGVATAHGVVNFSGCAGGAGQGNAIASPPVSASFAALGDDGTERVPDTQGAVGPNHLMVTLNSQVRIQDRAGGGIITTTLEKWWNCFGASNVFGPRVLYDPYGGRWIATAAGDRDTDLGLLLAVSQTSDPTGNWNLYFVSGAGPALDAPNVGFNTNRIVVQVNSVDDTGTNDMTLIYAFNKADLYASGSGLFTSWAFINSGDPFDELTQLMLNQVPAVTLDRNQTINYLMQDWFPNYQDPNNLNNYFGYLRVYSITGNVGSEVFIYQDSSGDPGPEPVSNPWWGDAFGFLPQSGSTNGIYPGDSRLVNVVFRNSSLWAAHTVFLPAGASDPTHSAVQWWEVSPGGNVLQNGRIEDTGGNVHYAYPSIGVNLDSDLLVGYSRFSASQFPSANYSFRFASDALSTIRSDTVLKAGEAFYNPKRNGFSINSWGAYSATIVDSLNDADLWTIQEYAAVPVGTNDHWGTWWGRVAPPVDLNLTMVDSPHSALIGGNITYTLVVTNLTTTNAANATRATLASGVKVTNTLPASLAYVSATSSQGSCGFSGGVVTCDLGNIAAKGQATITIVATTTVAGQVVNTATVFGNGQEIKPVDNTAVTTTTVNPAADLALLMTNSPDPVTQNSNLTYTLVVTNRGPSPATSVTLIDNVPLGVTYLFPITSTQGTNTTSGNTVTFTLGTINPGASVIGTVVVRATTTGIITNRASVSSTTSDPLTNNNSGATSARINVPPTIQSIINRTINEDTQDSFTFTISDPETPATSLIVTASSANQALIPNSNLILSGTGSPRTLTFTPLANQFGSATITLTVTDNDGVSSRTIWTETVTSVNDRPTLDPIGSVVVNEDSGPHTNILTGITTGAPNEPDTLTVLATSSNPALIPNPTVNYVNGNSTGTLIFTPATNAFGTVTISVTVNDNQAANNIVTQAFTVTIVGVNDPPTLNPLTNTNINEDASQLTINLSGITSGAANEPDTLGVTALSSDPSIIPNPTVTYTSPNSTGTLSFTPLPTKYGTVTITVTVDDHQPTNNLFQRQFSVTVNPVNDPPTLDAIAAVTLNEDAPLQTINLTGISSGAPNEFDTLTVNATSNNHGLIADPTVTYTSPNATGSIAFAPIPTKFGVATITVTVGDGQPSNNIVTRVFTVTVNAVNDPPTLDPISPLNITEDSGLRTINLTGISTGATNEADTLTVSAVSDNPSLIPSPGSVSYTAGNSTANFSITPVANAFGSAFITVTINDGQPTNNIVHQSFTVTVAPVNDPPTLNAISNISTNEDAPALTVNLSGISSGAANEPDFLTVTATSDNPTVVPDPTVNYTSPNGTGTLTLAPVPNAFGVANITVTVNDGQPSNNTVVKTFSVTLNAVNDSPTLNPIGNLTFDEDSGTQTVNLSGITSGAPNEFQTLSVTVSSNSNPALLTNLVVTYSSPATTGVLSLSTVTNAFGTALVTVTVTDGGTSNNFVRQTFMVTVNPVNDLPVLSSFADPVSTDEDVPLTLFFTASDVETPGPNLVLTAESSNEEVISAAGITFGVNGPNRTVTLRPLTNQFGSAFITITLTDGNGGSVDAGFEFDVNPVNDPPTISPIANQVTNQNASVTVLFTVDDVESLPDDLTVTATSSNPVVVPSANLVLGGSGANRTLTITPGAGQFGTSIIKVIATDGDLFTTNAFSFTVNSLPSISSVADQGIDEDTAITIPFTIGDFETPATSLLVSGSSSNPSLVSSASFNFGGTGSNRTVTITPLPNQFGSAVITLGVTDGNNVTTTTSFNLFVNAVNDPPTISAIPGQVINEDTTAAIPFTVGDAETPLSGLTLSGASSNPILVPNANLQFAGSGGSRTLTVTPATNQSGSANITVTVRDGDGLATSTTFLLTVNAVNDPPTLAGLADQTINEDTPLAIPFTVSDVDTALTSLSVSAGSSNPTLVPVANVVFGGSGANRTATITPATNQFGATVITINVNDGVTTTSGTFNLTVLSVNDLPTISSIANQNINEDTSTVAIAFTVGDVETAAASLAVVGSSSNPGLVPNSNVVIGGSGSSRTVTITPAANQFGTATIYITVTDGSGGATSNSFLLTVNPVNDMPTISSIAPQTVNEDTSISVPFTVGDPDTAIAALTVTAASTNTTLVPVANILPDGYGTSRIVTITPATNLFGTTLITLTVSDGVATASTSFVLTVLAANDPPTLDPIPNLFTNVSPGTVSVNLTGITSGAANESQTLTVTTTFTNPGLFASSPNVTYTSPSTTGIVAFKPSNSAVAGSSTITVTVSDGSATFSRSFTVYVKPSANIPPTITGIASQTVNEDTPTAAIPFTIGDDTTPVNSLSLTAYSSNTNLAPVANIVFGGSGSSRTITVTPAPNRSGTSTITISLIDTNFGGTNTSFLLTVNPVNDAPTISAIPPQTINEDTSTGPIPFMIGDVETAAASLTLTSTSSNLTLVPAANVVFGGNGTNRAVTVTPAANQSGTTLITVTVSDGLLTRSTNFLVTVNPVNDPPTISTVADQTVAEDTATSAIAFTVGDLETAATSLTVTGGSSDPVLVPNANITFGGSGTSRTVTLLPASNQYGTAIITLSVSDGTATTNTSFILTVTPVNDPPTLDGIGNVFINLGAGLQTVNLTGITAGPANENQVLAVSATSSDPGLIPNPAVNYISPNATGSLTFTPVSGTNGTATITVTVNDGQSLNNLLSRTFTVTVSTAPPLLSIVSAPPNAIVFWTTNASDFTLQGRDSFSSAWATVTTVPVRAGNQFYVTNSALNGNYFYRLIK